MSNLDERFHPVAHAAPAQFGHAVFGDDGIDILARNGHFRAFGKDGDDGGNRRRLWRLERKAMIAASAGGKS